MVEYMERVIAIKNSLFENQREITLERALLIKESYQKNSNQPMIIKRALAYQHILENHQIDIDGYDLLAGIRSYKPRAGVVSPEMSPYWIEEELDTFATRSQDAFYISKEDKEIYLQDIAPYFKGISLKDYYDIHCPTRIKDAQNSGIFAINQTDKGQGHSIPNYQKLLDIGFDGLINEVEKYLKQEPTNRFYQASLISVRASQQYVLRYARIVKNKIDTTTNTKRKEELERLYVVLINISSNKANTFYEAIQLFWLSCVMFQHESNASSISVGRFDQYMYPYYCKEENKELIEELLQCLYLKFNTIVAVRSEESAKYFAGFPIGYTMVLGGKEIGQQDTTNALSHLLLKIHHTIRLPQPNLSIRVHEKSPTDFLQEIAKTIRLGDGLPQLFNDEVIIDGFIQRGIKEEDAYEYAIVGCVELSLPGKMYGLHDIAMFNLLKCMEVTMYQYPLGFKDFEDFMSAIKETIHQYIRYMVDGSNICDQAHQEVAPTPMLSIFMDGCLVNGKDFTSGGATYNFSGVQGIGCPNLNDSLYVIKKMIFEEQRISYSDFLLILQENWKDQEALRQRCIHKYDKYGNDYDEVDTLGANLLSYYNQEVIQYKNNRGGIFQPGSYTVSAHIPLGQKVGATPDGRLAKEQLADGGLSPMVGRDIVGPTASLKSVSKLKNIETTNGSLLNVKFSPSTLEGDKGIDKLVAYIRAYCTLKIQHIQCNVISKETLVDAKKHPENYRHLVVRVAGYSAMFVELSKEIQDDIIHRSEHVL